MKQISGVPEAATAPKFGEVYKQIQEKYGEKPEKPREIKKTLGKDDFLKIMVTQMKNQDPTNPFKAEQMATEIAQFTTVEQLQNVNQNLGKMATQARPLEQMTMTNLIGKYVTIDRERFPHVDGQKDDIAFTLPKAAAQVELSIENDAGEMIFNKTLGAQDKGEVSFVWDGVKTNTLPAKTGNYRYRIEAKDQTGKPIEVNPQVQSRVIGVSFEGSEPVFLVGDAKHQDRVTMKNISRIEVEKTPIQNSAAGQASKTNPNLFSFQKGVGSMSASQAEEQEALAAMALKQQKALEQQARVPQEAPKPAMNIPFDMPLEKGFPNGLKDYAVEGNANPPAFESNPVKSETKPSYQKEGAQ